jgi:hypothetical protein
MATSQSPRRRRVTPLRVAVLAGALSLGGVSTANAQFCYAFWMFGAPCPVMESGGALIANVKSQIDTLLRQIEALAEYGEKAARWIRILQQFQDMMNSINSMISTLGLPAGVALERVPENYMVAEKCGVSGDIGSVLSSLMGEMVGFGMNDNTKRKQQELCVSIQRMQNRQFNEIVDYMKDSMGQLNTLRSQLASFRGTGTRTSGDMSGSIYEVEKTNGEIEQKMSEFQARMTAYNTYIKSQKQVQATLAQTTLRGKPSIMGEVIKTAALKTALSVP